MPPIPRETPTAQARTASLVGAESSKKSRANGTASASNEQQRHRRAQPADRQAAPPPQLALEEEDDERPQTTTVAGGACARGSGRGRRGSGRAGRRRGCRGRWRSRPGSRSARSRRNPSGRHGPARGEGEEEGGDADGEGGGQGELARQDGEDRGRDRDGQDQEAAKTALETNRRATRWMLRRIWRPSSTIGGTSPNSPRTSTRSATERAIWAAALGDREARLLQRGHVVDPVAEHRHVAALGSARRRPRLSSGEMRPTAGAAITAAPAARPVGGLASPSSAAGSRARRGRGRSPRGRPGVAGEHLEGDVLVAKKATVSAALGAQPLGDDDHPERPARRRGTANHSGRGLGQRRVGAPEREHAAPGGRLLARPLKRPGRRRRRARARPAPGARRRSRGRSSAGATRTGPAPTTPAAVWVHQPGIGDGLQRRVARRRAEQPTSESAIASVCSSTPSQEPTRRPSNVGSVSVPVLSVQTTFTDARDSTAFNCCARTPRWATFERRDRRREADQEDQPLGNEVHDTGGQQLHTLRCGVDARGGEVVEDGEGDRRERDRSRDEVEEQTVGRLLERRARGCRKARAVAVDFASAAIRADRRRLDERGAPCRRRTSPTSTRSPRPAYDGLGFAGQVGLVHGEPVRPHDRPVGNHLVARRQAHEITGHHLIDRHPSIDAATDDHRLRRDQRASRSSARLERISWNEPSRCPRSGSRGRARPATGRTQASARRRGTGSRSGCSACWHG